MHENMRFQVSCLCLWAQLLAKQYQGRSVHSCISNSDRLMGCLWGTFKLQVSISCVLLQQSGMNNWFGKSECTVNLDRLRGFYERVLDSFLEKIYKENRFKMSGGLDQQKIEQLGNHIRNYLKKPNLLFQKCIDMKEGSSRLEEAIKNQIINERYMPELKIQHEDEKDNYLAVQPKNDQEEKQDEEYQDDLAEYVDGAPQIHRKHEDKKRDGEVKREDNLLEYHVAAKSEVKIEEGGDSESEVDKNELTIKECEQSLNCIILGIAGSTQAPSTPTQLSTSRSRRRLQQSWTMCS